MVTVLTRAVGIFSQLVGDLKGCLSQQSPQMTESGDVITELYNHCGLRQQSKAHEITTYTYLGIMGLLLAIDICTVSVHVALQVHRDL